MISSLALQPVESLLCSRPWCADTYDGSVILFKPNSSGEIVSRAEHNICIVANFTWKTLKAGLEGKAESSPSDDDRTPALPTTETAAVLSIEMEIIRDDTPLAQLTSGAYVNPLLDSAFTPRELTVAIERGSFAARSLGPRDLSAHARFGLQMSFDKSPYPSTDAWPERWRDMVEDMRPFAQRVFFSERVEAGASHV